MRQNLPPPPPVRAHSRGEKRTLTGLIIFIAGLVGGGIIYSSIGTANAPPPPPETRGVEGYILRLTEPTRIARIVLPGAGTMCREIFFDNETGYFSVEKPVNCDTASPKGHGSSGSSFSSFKGAFGRK